MARALLWEYSQLETFLPWVLKPGTWPELAAAWCPIQNLFPVCCCFRAWDLAGGNLSWALGNSRGQWMELFCTVQNCAVGTRVFHFVSCLTLDKPVPLPTLQRVSQFCWPNTASVLNHKKKKQHRRISLKGLSVCMCDLGHVISSSLDGF